MRLAMRSAVVLMVLVSLSSFGWAGDLAPGDPLPDCSKIPLLAIDRVYRPAMHGVASLEGLLRPEGVAIVHFCSPRPSRGGPFRTYFLEELSALSKAAHSVPYSCAVIPVVPFGEKGRVDAASLLAQAEGTGDDGNAGDGRWSDLMVYYEPTYPHPGLYRTFRPAAPGPEAAPITTSWTFLIGPDRTVLAVRAPGENGQLYEWLQKNLPEKVVLPARLPSTRTSVAEPDDWAWPTFRRGVRRSADIGQMENRLPYTYVAWQRTVGGTFSSPAVGNGRVYVTTDNSGLRVLALSDGVDLAACRIGDSWWTSPVIAGDWVYWIASGGTVHALNRMSLEPVWKQQLGGLITSSPVVSEGALFVGCRDGAVYALDAANGDVLWTHQTGGEISSSPALADGLLLIGSGDRCLYALDSRTGQEKWSVATGGAVDSSPTVAGDHVFVGSFDGSLYSVELATGRVDWTCKLGGWVHSSPVADDDTVFVGTVNIRRDEVPGFYWIDRKTGKIDGRFETPGPIYSSPTIWDEQVLVGCRDGNVYAFDRKMTQTQPLWTFETRGYVHSSPVVVGDTLLVASFDRTLYALRQSKPITVWTDSDVVPRWFMAALAKQLHQQTGELIAKAAQGQVGQELRLIGFEDLFKQIRAEVMSPPARPRVLPRDVPPGHPGEQYIEYVLTGGLLGGYPDGTFRPSEPASRYQFCSALSAVLDWATRPDYVWRVLKDNELSGVQVKVTAQPVAGRPPINLADVPSRHWASRALAQQNAMGLLPVDKSGQFRGNELATVQDAGTQWDLIAQSVQVMRTQ